MAGETRRIRELSTRPLDLTSPISMKEPSRGYCEGGWIPEGTAFVVSRVVWAGRAEGDSNGGGLFEVTVGGQTIVSVEDGESDGPVRGTWFGSIELGPGSEADTFLAIANSSAGEALLEGALVPRESGAAFAAENAGFFATAAPPPEAADPGPALTTPRVVLQARSGAGGGNPNRIDLRGRTSLYVDRLSERPLDFSLPPAVKDESVAYFEGGSLPERRVFVVTAARWSGSCAGDSNGDGELKLVVAGEELLQVENSPELQRGQWSGRLRVLPGEESRTYLEIANTSAGDVLLTGYFEDL
jgi:hypothetical protein